MKLSYQERLEGYNQEKNSLKLVLSKEDYQSWIKELVEKWEI